MDRARFPPPLFAGGGERTASAFLSAFSICLRRTTIMPKCPANPPELQAGVAFRNVLGAGPRRGVLAAVHARAAKAIWRDTRRQGLSGASQGLRRRNSWDKIL